MRTVIAAAVAIIIAGCGGGTRTVTAPASPASQAATGATASNAQSQNDQVIQQASQASDNKAQLGANGIRMILEKKLGLTSGEDFDLSHRIASGDNGGDCYVKLGAEATNFEDQSQNILRSANGRDVVFVQSNTVTPLVKCLKAVRGALRW